MNIFKQLAEGVQNTEVMYTVEKEGVSAELYGTVVITKGGLQRKKSYWARISPHGAGVVSIDEWDGDWQETSFNGLKIDSYDAFIKGFSDHGMSSVAESLKITSDEVDTVIYQAVANHKMFKLLFKKSRLFELFTPAETKVHHYNLFIDGKYVPTQKKVDYGWTVDGKDLSIEEVIALENN